MTAAPLSEATPQPVDDELVLSLSAVDVLLTSEQCQGELF